MGSTGNNLDNGSTDADVASRGWDFVITDVVGIPVAEHASDSIASPSPAANHAAIEYGAGMVITGCQATPIRHACASQADTCRAVLVGRTGLQHFARMRTAVSAAIHIDLIRILEIVRAARWLTHDGALVRIYEIAIITFLPGYRIEELIPA